MRERVRESVGARGRTLAPAIGPAGEPWTFVRGWRILPMSGDRAPVDWTRTVHGVGDLHAGAIRRARAERVLDDAAVLGTPALHLQIGDATEHGIAEEDRKARRWLSSLPGPNRTILGNHDILHNRRTPAQWARAYGYASKNYVVDLPFVRIVAVAP